MSSEKGFPEAAGNPRFCDIVITNRCLLQCKMCKAWQCGPQSHELSFEDAKKFVDSLSRFVKEPLEINVMGGEPLWKDWCLDLCQFISRKGFKSIISTNAYLIDEDMAKRIADSGLNVLAISLESLNPKTHNDLRGRSDVFAKVMKAIEYLEKYCGSKLTLTILTILMEKNLDEVLELTEWVNKHRAIQNISFLALLETGLVPERKDWFKSPVYKELWPQNTEKVHRLIDRLIDLRKSGYKIWNPVSQLDAMKEYYVDPDQFMRDTPYKVHDYILDLDEKGDIYLSGDVLGNVREDDLKTLWFSPKADELRQKIATRGPGRRCCVINFICAFPPDEQYAYKDFLPGNPRAHVQGFRFLDQKEFEKAREEFLKALRLDPQSEHAHHGLGLCYQHAKQYDEAIKEFECGLKINPKHAYIYNSLGFCYKDLGRLDEAAEAFRTAAGLNPQDPNSCVGLGFCYLDQKKHDEAIAQFRKALELSPDHGSAHHGLGACYREKGQFDQGAEAFRKALEIRPDDPHAHEGLAYCYKELGRKDAAVAEFQWLLRACPSNENYHMGLGFCYKELGQLDQAMGAFGKALAINPWNFNGHIGLGFCALEQQKTGEAMAEFRKALELCPQSDAAYQGLGTCYQRQEAFETAAGEFQKALTINSDNYYVHQGLADCYQRLEQFEASIREFQWLLRIHPRNEHYLMGMGCSYEGLRQFDKAVEYFEEALKINPDIEGAQHCIATCKQSLRQQRRN